MPDKTVDKISRSCYYAFIKREPLVCAGEPVIIAKRVHPFPSRTRKLSSSAPMILWGQLHGKIGHRRFTCPYKRFLFLKIPFPLLVTADHATHHHQSKLLAPFRPDGMRAVNLKKKDRASTARSDWWESMGFSQSQDVATPFGLGVTLVVGITIGVTSFCVF